MARIPPEDPWDVWRKRGFGSDFPAEFFAEFDKEFARMQGMIGRIMEDVMKHASSPQRGEPFVYGFSMRIGKDGVPHLTPFGSAVSKHGTDAAAATAKGLDPGTPQVEAGEERLIREPLSDVIEGEHEVSVTVELPGVEKGDLSLHVADQAVNVRVDRGARRYHKRIKLPCKVVPSSAKATFKNGILDVTIQRQERQDEGHTVAIE